MDRSRLLCFVAAVGCSAVVLEGGGDGHGIVERTCDRILGWLADANAEYGRVDSNWSTR